MIGVGMGCTRGDGSSSRTGTFVMIDALEERG